MRPREGERERVRRVGAVPLRVPLGVRERPREGERVGSLMVVALGSACVGVAERSREGLRWWAGEDMMVWWSIEWRWIDQCIVRLSRRLESAVQLL